MDWPLALGLVLGSLIALALLELVTQFIKAIH